MADVARAAGVSRSLVSLVFQDSPKVAAVSRKKVLAEAERLGYRTNILARSLASKQVRTLGVLLDDIANPFFATVYDSIADAAEAAGYGILLGAGQRSSSREESIVSTFMSHRVGGLILVSPRMTAGAIESCSRSLSTVIVGRDVRLPHVDAITNDEAGGVRMAIDHLVGLGHREIVHVSGGRGAGAAQRRTGYVSVMREYGLSERARVIPGDFTEEAGKAAARQLLAEHALPTAVLTANDLVAVGLMAGLQSAGLKVPHDVSIVGYDNLAISELTMVSLTTVAQPLAEFGRAATGLLLERLQGGRQRRLHRQFEPRLIVRGSTAAARRHRPR
jgi:DNA-binding LacI/PurR family transcriptional regulator